jgi:signal peptidase I
MEPENTAAQPAVTESRGRRVPACLLSLVTPGAGHFLVRRFRRGAAWEVGLPALGFVVGDLFLADRAAYRARTPARGEQVVRLSPAGEGQRQVKRVIGLPGETVQVRGGRAFVDGRPLSEPHVAGDRAAGTPDAECEPPSVCEPVIVPDGAYYLLGDDRENSKDSRHWGFVVSERILGRASVIYWSWDPERGRPRLERIGSRP